MQGRYYDDVESKEMLLRIMGKSWKMHFMLLQFIKHQKLKNAGERIEMKIIYDPQTDSLTLILREMAVKESDEIREDLIVDYGEDDKIIAIEVLNASENISEPQAFLYEIKGQKAVPKAIA